MSSVVVVSADDSSTTLFPLPSGSRGDIRSVRLILGSTTVEITAAQGSDHEHSSTNGFTTMEIRLQAPTTVPNPVPSASPSPPPSPLPGDTSVTESAPASTAPHRRCSRSSSSSSSRLNRSRRRASSFAASSSHDDDDDKGEGSGQVGKEEQRLRARRKREYVKKMRGWLMVVATLVASAAFSGGTNLGPDKGFFYDSSLYILYIVFTSVAFGLSLGSIILLMGENTFHGTFKVQLLRVFVVGAIFALAVSFCFTFYPSVAVAFFFFVSLIAFLGFVTVLTWWYNKKRGEAVIWRLRSLSLGRLFRWRSNAIEIAEEDHNGRP